MKLKLIQTAIQIRLSPSALADAAISPMNNLHNTELEIEGFVLTGGGSSRMGSEKACLSLAGKTFVERAALALRTVTRNVSLVGGNPKYNLGLPVLPDIYQVNSSEKRASIIGLHAALVNSKTSWAAVLACDMPFVTGELFVRLASLGEIREQSNFGAVVLVQPDGEIQPFCALYNRAVCLPRVEEMLAADNWRAQEIFTRLTARYVKFSEVSDLPGAENFFFNVNTPEEMRIAVTLASDFET